MDTMSTNTQSGTFVIHVPAEAMPFLDRAVQRGGFTGPEQYIAKLLEEAQVREEQERLEADLLKGINSGPAETMTKEDWAALRQKARDRAAAGRR
jgi:hypothetical protein